MLSQIRWQEMMCAEMGEPSGEADTLQKSCFEGVDQAQKWGHRPRHRENIIEKRSRS